MPGVSASGPVTGGLWWASLSWGPGIVTVLVDGTDTVVRVLLADEPRGQGQPGGPADGVLRQIAEYLSRRRRAFRVRCRLPPPETFTGRLLASLEELVPFGRTATYGQVAEALGRPGAARAVGRALAANPCPILVPCHRVVAARGLGGFGPGLEWKRALLALESEGRPG